MTYRIACALLLTLTLAACVPATLEPPSMPTLVLLAAPASSSAPNAGAALTEAVQATDPPFAVATPSLARFLELRRGLVGAQIPAAAARIARALEADLAVVFETVTLERTLLGDGAEDSAYRVEVAFRMQLIDAGSGAVLTSRDAARVTREAPLEVAELPDLAADELVLQERDAALDIFVPWLLRTLDELPAFTGSSGE